MESLQDGVTIYFQATSLFSMRKELLASSQTCCSVDADAWCKGAPSACDDTSELFKPGLVGRKKRCSTVDYTQLFNLQGFFIFRMICFVHDYWPLRGMMQSRGKSP